MSDPPNEPVPTWCLGETAAFLASPHGCLAARVLATEDLELEFLRSSWARQHALIAVLDRLAGAEISDRQLQQLAADFLALAPVALVQHWYGATLPGLKAILGKLGSQRSTKPGVYRQLVSMLRLGGVGAKTLHHRRQISFGDIERLAALPDWLRTHEFRLYEPELGRVLAGIGEALLARGICRNTVELRQLFASNPMLDDPFPLLLDRGVSMTFPAPPWPGDDQLQPLRSSSELVAAAEEFRNCLKSRISDCFAGRAFIYIFRGKPSAVLEIQQLGLYWACVQIAGVGNATVPEAIEAKIHEALQGANRALWERLDAPVDCSLLDLSAGNEPE